MELHSIGDFSQGAKVPPFFSVIETIYFGLQVRFTGLSADHVIPTHQ